MTTRSATPRRVVPTVVRGWAGPAAVALATAATAGGLGLLLALLAKPVDLGLANTLALATAIATGALGADLRVVVSSQQGETFFAVDGDAALGAAPLTVTLLALVAGVVVFRRATRHETSRLGALGDAARAALLLGPCLAVPALVLTADNDELGRGWGRALSQEAVGYRLDVGTDPLAAALLGSVLLLTVLGVTAVTGRGSGPPDAGVRGLIVPSVGGLVAVLASLPLAGVVGVLALLPGEGSGGELPPGAGRAGAAVVLGGLPNAGAWLLALGAGAPVHASVDATGRPGQSVRGRLPEVTGSEPGLWVAPVVLVAVLALATWVVLRRAGRGRSLPALGVWLVTLAVTLPALARLASVRFVADLDLALGRDVERVRVAAEAGPDVLQTTLLVLLVAALVSALVATVAAGAVRAGFARGGARAGARPGTDDGAPGPSSGPGAPRAWSSGLEPGRVRPAPGRR